MPVAGWRAGMPTRCGMCLKEEIDYRDDGAAVCRSCGSVTVAYWARSKAVPSGGKSAEAPGTRPGARAARPPGPPPLAVSPAAAPGPGPSEEVVDRARRLLWAAAPVHLLAAVVPVLLFGGAGGWLLAVGVGAQVAFAAVAALGALRFLASPKMFAMPMTVVGVVALLFSAVVYGGIVGVVGGALLIVAWWSVRPKGA